MSEHIQKIPLKKLHYAPGQLALKSLLGGLSTEAQAMTQRASTNRLEAHQGVVKRPAETLEVHQCAHAGDCILDKHRLKAEDELLSYKMHLVITL